MATPYCLHCARRPLNCKQRSHKGYIFGPKLIDKGQGCHLISASRRLNRIDVAGSGLHRGNTSQEIRRVKRPVGPAVLPAEGAGVVRAFEVVLASAVRELLLELDWEERELLTGSILSELRSCHDRTFEVPGGCALVTEICGYLITYRSLSQAEKERYSVADGHFVVRIESVLKGLPK
jgi:hypothetical protein